MGLFNDKMELMSCATIRSAFIKVKLFDPEEPHESINKLTCHYIQEQLKNVPGGTQQFNHLVMAAHNTFAHALLHDQMAAEGLLPFLYTHLIRETSEKVENMLIKMKEDLVNVLITTLRQSLFSPEIGRKSHTK